VARFKAEGMQYKQLTFAEPYLRELSKMDMHLTDACNPGRLLLGRGSGASAPAVQDLLASTGRVLRGGAQEMWGGVQAGRLLYFHDVVGTALSGGRLRGGRSKRLGSFYYHRVHIPLDHRNPFSLKALDPKGPCDLRPPPLVFHDNILGGHRWPSRGWRPARMGRW
jgi:hypothetical protein